ncbi:MAG: hypothetical protein AABW85_04520 [archaeon]
MGKKVAELIVLSAKAMEAVDALQERLSAKQWGELSRTSFVYNTTQTINALEDLAVLFEEMNTQLQKEGSGGTTELKQHLTDIKSLITVLSRNKEMEETRLGKAKEKGIELIAENAVAPDQYSSLEQKVFSTALKTRYIIERINIQTKKQENSPFMGTKSTKNVLDILSEKENELQLLREKIDELRNTESIARLATDTPADFEREVNEYTRKLHTESRILAEAFGLNKKKLSELEYSYRQLEAKIGTFDQIQSNHLEKTIDLVTSLKKERDYAKKLVMDIEGETMALRNSYTQKLLGLEQQISRAKSEAFENYRKTISKQENELKDKAELILSLRGAVKEREHKIKKLEERLAQPKEKGKKTKQSQF